MGLFQEYMDAKGKIVKPKIDISGGDPSPKTPPSKPPKEHGDKPYANSNGKGSKNNKDKGFGDQGDQSLKYTPSDNPSSKGHPPANIPTVEQIELASLVAEAATKDQSLIENLVRQIKANGLMGPLVAEMLQYKEAYSHMSHIMGDSKYGADICKNMVRAMSEEVAPPFHSQMNLDDEEGSEQDEYDDNNDSSDQSGIQDETGMDPAAGGENLNVSVEEPGPAPAPVSPQMPGQMPQAPQPLMQMQQMTPAMKNFQRALMSRF